MSKSVYTSILIVMLLWTVKKRCMSLCDQNRSAKARKSCFCLKNKTGMNYPMSRTYFNLNKQRDFLNILNIKSRGLFRHTWF